MRSVCYASAHSLAHLLTTKAPVAAASAEQDGAEAPPASTGEPAKKKGFELPNPFAKKK